MCRYPFHQNAGPGWSCPACGATKPRAEHALMRFLIAVAVFSKALFEYVIHKTVDYCWY